MQLHEGYMSLKDLSIWFGLKPNTLRNSSFEAKQKKIEKLKNFCDFHFENNKLYIDTIYISEYSKAYDVIEKNYLKEWGLVIDPQTRQVNWQRDLKVDTCTRVGKVMWKKYPEARQVKESTAIAYVGSVRRADYGNSYQKLGGTKGYCQVVYVNEDDTGLLNEEEVKVVKECRQEAYKDVNERRNMLDEALAVGEISQQKWSKAIGDVDTKDAFGEYQELLLEKLGFIPIRRTQLVDGAF